MIRLRIVTQAVSPVSDPVLNADEARLYAHCSRLSTTRTLALLIAMAAYVPDELLFQWRTCYRDAEALADWLPDAA